MKRFERHVRVDTEDASTVDLLTADTGLSRQAIKAAMGKGAVWLTRRRHTRRLRRLAEALDVFQDRAVHLVTQSANDLNLTLVVDEPGSTRLVQLDERVAHERMQSAFQRLSASIERYGGTTHELRRATAEGHLCPSGGAEEIRHEREITTLDPGE